jgi:hypothetical protein
MKKRVIKKRVNKWIKWFSNYTEVPLKTVKEECYDDLYKLVKGRSIFYLDMYTDCKSIDLMEKYQCGWWVERESEE